MHAKTTEMMGKFQQLLIDNEYMPAKDLAEKTGMSKGSIFRMIRILRENHIGVLVTRKGYVLSKYAKKNDDVTYLRRLLGRRTSDYVSLVAARPDILHRWRSVSDRRTLRMITSPLTMSPKQLTTGMKIVLSKVNGMGL